MAAMFTQMQSLVGGGEVPVAAPRQGTEEAHPPHLRAHADHLGREGRPGAAHLRGGVPLAHRDARVVIVREAAHMIMIEQRDEWVRLVGEFLG